MSDKSTTVKIDPELRDELKRKAIDMKLTLQELVDLLLKEGLKKLLILILLVPCGTYASDAQDFKNLNLHVDHISDFVQRNPQYEAMSKNLLKGKMMVGMPVSMVLLARKGYAPAKLERDDAKGNFEFYYKVNLNGKLAYEYFIFKDFKLIGYVFKLDGVVRQEI